MIDPVLTKAEEKMKTSLDVLKREMGGIRTGRASPALVENVRVDYNGAPTPIHHMASVTASGASLLMIQPWDAGALTAIEKAILKANIGLTPTSDGHVIRLNIPPLDEERRQEMIKMMRRLLEEQRIVVRNIRRDAIDDIKKQEKNKEISQDDLKRGETRLQKLTDSYIGQIDATGVAKEAELKQI
ncbi:MAG: ribosome recycling factor [Dehalococcoidia bacterium]|nr:ribosome recycling factor [Dehalococcoidia bacterium]